MTAVAGPTQREMHSYQIPIDMMFIPEYSRSMRQCIGASRFRKPVGTRRSIDCSSPM